MLKGKMLAGSCKKTTCYQASCKKVSHKSNIKRNKDNKNLMIEIIVWTNCFPIIVTPKDEMDIKQVILFFILWTINIIELKTIP